MTGVPRGTPFFFFDSFSAAAAPDASAKTSAAASAESLRVLPCRTIFLKRRGDVGRERPKAHAAAAPLLLAVDAGERTDSNNSRAGLAMGQPIAECGFRS